VTLELVLAETLRVTCWALGPHGVLIPALIVGLCLGTRHQTFMRLLKKICAIHLGHIDSAHQENIACTSIQSGSEVHSEGPLKTEVLV
jgi:hypothetical protein